MQQHLSRIAGTFLDLVFPLSCIVCQREGHYVCDGCEAKLPKLEAPYCTSCARPGSGTPCWWCKATEPAFDGITTPYLFTGPVREAVHSLKYRGVRAAAPAIAKLIAAALNSNSVDADLLIPVPLHPRRERQRGYNQSALLGKEVSRLSDIPVYENAMRRVRDAPPQVSMKSAEERLRNIRGAFECVGDVEGKRILLVDDVVTTGSTMSACATPLKAAGAASVWGLALARQP